jgi:hypothetical protein
MFEKAPLADTRVGAVTVLVNVALDPKILPMYAFDAYRLLVYSFRLVMEGAEMGHVQVAV